MTEEASSTPQPDTSTQIPADPDSLIAFIEKASGPVHLEAVTAAFGGEDGRREAIGDALDGLVARGDVVKTRDGRFGSPAKMNLVVGRLQCHEKGFGFVVPRDPGVEDLYIPHRKLGDGLHGDLVVARRESTKKHKTEGRVIRLLERARTQVVGRFERGRKFGYVAPLDPRIGYEVFIAESDAGDAKPGQLVTAEITRYPEGKGRRNPEGKVIEVLGDPDDARLDVEVIIREFGLAHEFPAEVVAEAEKLDTEVTDEDLEGREDFRDLPVVTIDGENAKDFDDAVHVVQLINGNYQLTIHIADVSAYVPVGSAIDEEARRRTTSVYFPDRVVPMLPERLSNEICSLKPGVDRLVQSVTMEIDGRGRTVDFRVQDGVIRSAARMTYREVAALLDGGDDKLAKKYADHVEHFQLMSKLCEVLRRYRAERGSIDFDLPEPEMRINMVGEVEDIFRSERNQAHRIIEEFMIRANEVVASHMEWEDVASPFRVHEGPDEEKVEQFREFIGGIGLHLGGGKRPDSSDFQKLVGHLEGQPSGRTLIYLMLRTMKQARYQVDNIGHFGLASPRYTHFTSPIRRYPDLIVHRLLKADLNHDTQEEFDVPGLRARLHNICTESSERERTASEAERRYVDWKTVQFMADKQGDEFEAFITGVHAYGFFVELEKFFVEGLVHVSALDDDYYQFDERKHTLRGDGNGRTFALGNRVKVRLAKVDMERRRLDFQVIEGPIESGIKPLEKSEPDQEAKEAQEAAPSGRRRRRRRRGRGGRGKKSGKQDEPTRQAQEKGAKASDDERKGGSAQAGQGDQRGKQAKQDDGRRKQSKQRHQGGKKAKQDDSGKQAKGADKSESKGDKSDESGKQKAGSRRRRSRRGGRGRGKSRDDKQKADGKGGRRGEQRQSKKKTDDGTSSRRRRAGSDSGKASRTQDDSGNGRGRQSSSQSKPEGPEKAGKVEPPKKSERPKVNPYLTDL